MTRPLPTALLSWARRPISSGPQTLWGEIALVLTLTLAALIVLNTGIVWLVMGQVQTDARIALTEQVAATVSAELSRASADEGRESAYRSVIGSFRSSDLDILELYVTDANLSHLASLRGRPPKVLDAGLREALFGHTRSISVEDRFRATARVVVTQPIPPEGRPVAALRVSMPIESLGILGSRWGFLAFYAGFTMLVVGVSGFVLFKQRLVLPIETVKKGTERIAAGDFDHRVSLEASAELMALVDALNKMAASLADYRQRTQDQVRHLEDANRALARAQDDLIRSARLASVGRLAAGLAHEVGNPLAAVVGYVDLLRQEPRSSFSADLLDRTAREVERIHLTIRELLEYARPGRGEPVQVRPAEILDAAIDTVRYQPGFKDVTIEREIAPDLPEIHVEPDKLLQVLVNLLLNAVDATGPNGRIAIQLSARDDDVCLEVRDTGPGLTPEALEHLFEPFFSTKAPGKGAGLGLATSQGLIERMGGRITGRNHPDGGAEFTVRLPSHRPTRAPC